MIIAILFTIIILIIVYIKLFLINKRYYGEPEKRYSILEIFDKVVLTFNNGKEMRDFEFLILNHNGGLYLDDILHYYEKMKNKKVSNAFLYECKKYKCINKNELINNRISRFSGEKITIKFSYNDFIKVFD